MNVRSVSIGSILKVGVKSRPPRRVSDVVTKIFVNTTSRNAFKGYIQGFY